MYKEKAIFIYKELLRLDSERTDEDEDYYHFLCDYLDDHPELEKLIGEV